MASVLRRKADRGRQASAGLRAATEPGRALADAIRRAAEEELALTVVAQPPRERLATPAEIIEQLPEHALAAILIGPENGAGLLCLDPAALAAVIEMRTTGRVSAQLPQARRPTRIDAAMTADLIDRILAEFEAPLLETEEARWAAGWRYQLFLPDPRPLPVVLEDAVHRIFEAEVLLGDAARPGRVLIALPATGRAQPRVAEPPPADSARARTLATWECAMDEAVGSAEVTLDAVLGRVRLSLRDLARLQPGDRLALPMSALSGVQLLATGGKTAAAGRLGQAGGARAVKIAAVEAALPPRAEGSVIAAGTMRSAHPGGFPAGRSASVRSSDDVAAHHVDAAIGFGISGIGDGIGSSGADTLENAGPAGGSGRQPGPSQAWSAHGEV